MNDYYTTLLIEQLEAVSAKRSRVTHKKLTCFWSDVPESARPMRPKANSAFFYNQIYRRRGYLAAIAPEGYLALCKKGYLNKDVERLLEELWCRGNQWLPLTFVIKEAKHGWVLAEEPRPEDIQIAYFLSRKEMPGVRVQLLIEGDAPASREGLESLNTKGLCFEDSEAEPITLDTVEVCL